MNNTTNGYIVNIQNFSVQDGDGIRTTVFFAGCPLCCSWCANPETCHLPNNYVQSIDSDTLYQKLKKQFIYFKNNRGGVTFSGGEATMQPDFLRSISSKLYDSGISMTLETCGFFSFDNVCDILKKMDLIFIDLKLMNAKLHKKYTGQDNELILDNIKKIAKLSVPVVIRIPLIVSVNADSDNIISTAIFVKNNIPNAKIELLPYHTYGEKKYNSLHLNLPSSSFQIPSKELIEDCCEIIHSYGIETISYS